MLPEAMQNQILEYELSISILRPLDAEERATVFFMRNQAVALSKMDLSLVMLGEEAMDVFVRLCEHNFMQSKIKLTAPARRKHDDLRVLLQFLILCKRVSMGFSGVEIMGFCDDIKNGEEQLEESYIQAVLDYLDAAVEEKRKYLKLVHLPVVLFIAKQAREKEMPCDEFTAKLDAFFENLDEGGGYMTACKSGSAKRGNVQTRVSVMEDAVLKVKKSKQ
jgi:hypothetical protein